MESNGFIMGDSFHCVREVESEIFSTKTKEKNKI